MCTSWFSHFQYCIGFTFAYEWRNDVFGLEKQDLATAFVQVLGNEKASKQVFNISGEKYVTFNGLAKACAKVLLATAQSLED